MNASLTKPMSSNSPSRRYWPRWLSFYWMTTNAFGWLAARSQPFNWLLTRTVLSTMEKLTKLSFINFARWSIVRRVPANEDNGHTGNTERLPYGYVLFETNYNGDQDLYFEAFSLVTPVAMMLTWQRCFDVPWIPHTGRFIDFINKKELPIDTHLSYCAYPSATSKVIRQALALKREVRDFQSKAPVAPEGFKREYTSLLTRVQTLADPRPPAPGGLRKLLHGPATGETSLLSILTPVKASRKEELRTDLALIGDVLKDPGSDASALFPGTTHLARWVVIDPLQVPDVLRDQPRPEQSYLLFSAWFDGDEEQVPDAVEGRFLETLYETLATGPVGPQLWEHCGFDDTGQAGGFRTYLVRHKVKVGVKFSGYDGSKVEEVRHALHLYEKFYDFAVDAQGFDAARLQREWRDREIGGSVGVGP
jgi:hypothetical protein